MKSCIITFRSVTFAQRGQRVLERRGISCRLRRTPRWMEEQGCGYSLELRAGDAPGAVAALRQEGVPLRRVYRSRPDGTLEEVGV